MRGIRPFLDQQRMTSAATRQGGGPAKRSTSAAGAQAPRLRGADRSAAARRRTVLEQSFGHLPQADGPFAGRRRAD